eukprot:TRINITY_DN73048_c0_g1_i1.p1 TRINITY_DN73048_c0_g1~~TRINITY_DN73048_c0_g1_i1.p1  ORF type:complete len:286 (-),score=38.38 TRINITY_DN73048_c0_g1_i1:201-1058(-)
MLNGFAKELPHEALVNRSEDSDAEEDANHIPCLKRACLGVCCCLVCALSLIIVVWLILALIAGSPGDPEYKHAFVTMAPLRSIKLTELNANTMPLIVGKAPLPPQLRGVFWLSDQGKSSALATFGGPNDDKVVDGGKPCSSGDIGSDKKYCIRVSGDRTWSLRSSFLAWLYATIDIRYIFNFDSAEDPTYATIQSYSDLQGRLPGFDVFFFSELFDMALMKTHDQFNNSVVWKRTSVLPTGNSTYDFIQVMDEHGELIEPAWSAFLDYEINHVGGDDLYYRSYRE